jgi:hypothetical protein
MKLNSLLFVDDKVIIYVSEDNIFTPNRTNTWNENFNSENQNPSFVGIEPIRSRIEIDNAILDQVNVSHTWVVTFRIKERKEIFQNHKIFTSTGTFNNIFTLNLVQRASRLKLYKTLALPYFLYGSEIWTLRQDLINMELASTHHQIEDQRLQKQILKYLQS